jgi:hypothetical protein
MHETCAPVWHMRVECEQRDELAPLISMTSSASASRLAGMVSPSALAVLRLITSSNLVGCSTGGSAGLSPLRTRARVQAGLPTCLGNASTIAHQSTGFRGLTQVITRGKSILDRQCGELIALTEEERIGGSAPAWAWRKVAKGCIEVAFGACMDDMTVQRPGAPRRRARCPRRAPPQ